MMYDAEEINELMGRSYGCVHTAPVHWLFPLLLLLPHAVAPTGAVGSRDS